MDCIYFLKEDGIVSSISLMKIILYFHRSAKRLKVMSATVCVFFFFRCDEPPRYSIQKQVNRSEGGGGVVPGDGAKADIKLS
jgi:hypothetical protein